MWEAFAAADLVLCRAGATTLAELTVAGKAAILVPLRSAAEDHQTWNAKAMVARAPRSWSPRRNSTRWAR